MDYLTKFYKNKAESLLEQVKNLETKLKELNEQSPPGYSLSEPGPRQSNEQLKERLRQVKRTGLFGAEVPEDKQSEEYRAIQSELVRRNNSTTSASGQPAPVQAGTRPQLQPNTEPQRQLKNLPPKAKQSQNTIPLNNPKQPIKTTQVSSPPYLLQRDPNVPTPPARGQPAPVQGGTRPQQTSIGPNSDWANQQRAQFNREMIQSALGSTSPTQTSQTSSLPSVGQLFGTQPTPAKTQPYNFGTSSADLLNKASNLLSGLGSPKPIKTTQVSSPPYLLQRDPNVPTPPARGQPAPVQGGTRPQQQPQQPQQPLWPNMTRSEFEQSAMNPSGAATPTAKGLPVNPYTGNFYQQPEAAPNAARPGTPKYSLHDTAERQRAANTPTAAGRKAYEEMMTNLGGPVKPIDVDQFMKYRADSTGYWYKFP